MSELEDLRAKVAAVEALAEQWIGFGMCALYESPLEIGQMVREALESAGSKP